MLLAAVVVVGRHLSEACDFARLADHARPSWLLIAVALQAVTYVSQGQVYRVVAHADGDVLGILAGARLSITKLFVDQAIPSAGLSGTVAVAASLQQRGISRGIVSAGILADLTGDYAAYALCLVVSLFVRTARGKGSSIVLASALTFVLFAIASMMFAISLAGRRRRITVPAALARFRAVRSTLEYIRDAEPRLARSRKALLQSSACHLAILFCDASTVWILILAFGGGGPRGGVFTSFIVSNVLRTVAFFPGGLGTFEAASVAMLHAGGIPVALALSATLVFRGLSFWLPMLPGCWLWRRQMRQKP